MTSADFFDRELRKAQPTLAELLAPYTIRTAAQALAGIKAGRRYAALR